MLQEETTCGRKSVFEQKWRQMYSIPPQHSPCGEHRSETGTCDKTEETFAQAGRVLRGEREEDKE